jgi:hypothetical protein
VFINSGFQRLDNGRHSRRLRELSAMQFDLVTAWDTVRHDYITFEMAREYLRTEKPRVIHIALGETDDWGLMTPISVVLPPPERNASNLDMPPNTQAQRQRLAGVAFANEKGMTV